MKPPSVPGLAASDLPPRQIHVWLADPGRTDARQLEERHAHLLSATETARHQAFRFARDRHHYLAAHALARRVLADATGVAPGDLVFATEADGKPYPVLPPGHGKLGFNLSHTDGLVACVLARGMDCGVDVEVRRPLDDMDSVAKTLFAPAELARLQACPPQQRGTHFFTLWTLREAYAKATGAGIAADLRHIDFAIGKGGTVHAHIDGAAPDGYWHFHSQAAGPDHLLAVAARARAPGPVTLSVHERTL